MSGEKVYTPMEVAEILKVSRATVYNYITAGKLETIKVGHGQRITEETLNNILSRGIDTTGVRYR